MFKSNLISFLILTSFFIFILSKPEDYEFELERLESISGDKETLVDATKLKVIRKKKLHYISGLLVFKVDMDNAFGIAVQSAYSPLGNGQFVNHAFRIPMTPICDFYNTTYRKYLEPSFIGHMNFSAIPPDGLCPLPKGVYYIEDVALQDDNLPNHVPKGVWRIEEKFHDTKDCIGGIRLFVRVTTKYN